MKTRDAAIAALAAACVALGAASAPAAIILEDLNSSAVIDLVSPGGVLRWTVDDVENLRKQWFWYRIGDAGPEKSLDTLTLDIFKTSSGDLDPGDERLIARYLGAGFSITADYILTGGPAGSGASDMAEVITLRNTGVRALDFHFFQYVDLYLKGDSQDQSVEILNGNTAVQKDVGMSLSETVVTWSPTHHQVAEFDDILKLLTNAGPDDLNDFAGPLGPGNLTWAFQWDVDLQPGASFIISKDKNLVPEPACLALLGLGAIALALRRRRR